MRRFIPFLSFTIISLGTLIFQQIYLNSIIKNYALENYSLKKKIILGHKKHKEIIDQKELEKNSIIAGIKYSYSVNKGDSVSDVRSIEFQKGYEEGYHNAIKQQSCPAN